MGLAMHNFIMKNFQPKSNNNLTKMSKDFVSKYAEQNKTESADKTQSGLSQDQVDFLNSANIEKAIEAAISDNNSLIDRIVSQLDKLAGNGNTETKGTDASTTTTGSATKTQDTEATESSKTNNDKEIQQKREELKQLEEERAKIKAEIFSLTGGIKGFGVKTTGQKAAKLAELSNKLMEIKSKISQLKAEIAAEETEKANGTGSAETTGSATKTQDTEATESSKTNNDKEIQQKREELKQLEEERAKIKAEIFSLTGGIKGFGVKTTGQKAAKLAELSNKLMEIESKISQLKIEINSLIMQQGGSTETQSADPSTISVGDFSGLTVTGTSIPGEGMRTWINPSVTYTTGQAKSDGGVETGAGTRYNTVGAGTPSIGQAMSIEGFDLSKLKNLNGIKFNR